MKPMQPSVLAITKPHDQPQLSKAQLKFNQLMKKIAGHKQRLLDWQEALPLLHLRLSKEYQPIIVEFYAAKKEVVQLLDRALADKKIKGRERNRISEIICILASDIVSETDDEEIKEIYNYYSDGDFDAELSDQQEMAKAMASDLLGLDLEAEGIDFSASPDEVLQQLLAAAQRKAAAEGARESEQAEPERKKSKKQLQSEAKREAAEKEVSLSVREVYRKLAASLHPDREQDEQERLRKTELMQRVNVAYENKDLLTLLNLQLEIEQIDQQHINSLSEVRLKHYIQVLNDQAAELQMELSDMEGRAMAMVGMRTNSTVTPKKIMASLHERILELKHHTLAIKRDVVHLQHVGNLKEWVRVNYDALMQGYDEQAFY